MKLSVKVPRLKPVVRTPVKPVQRHVDRRRRRVKHKRCDRGL